MRIFVAIDLEDSIREKIVRFLDGVREFVPEARWVRPESLHVTLKFIGEQREEQVAAIKETLRGVSCDSMEIRFRGYGFFPTATAPRVFWIGIQAGEALEVLAHNVDIALGALKIPREERPFSPHLTLARAAGGSGAPRWRKGDRANSTFSLLQKRLAALREIDFGTMTAREFFLYQSQLSPSGSKYTKLQSFPLH
ncbi:MAG: RNA 2',3'-cyclic phosphodiesterase [Acidobacteria bacterium]|nr:RNA 2',3'-cyclic phosphodiesterase [Acidobacteriota bacterium]